MASRLRQPGIHLASQPGSQPSLINNGASGTMTTDTLSRAYGLVDLAPFILSPLPQFLPLGKGWHRLPPRDARASYYRLSLSLPLTFSTTLVSLPPLSPPRLSILKVRITQRNDLVLNVLAGGTFALLKLAEPVPRREFHDISWPTDLVSPSLSFHGLPCPRETRTRPSRARFSDPFAKATTELLSRLCGSVDFPTRRARIRVRIFDYSAVEEATTKLTLRKVIAEGQRDAGVSK